MSDRFKEKYRTESARLQGWDYGRDAAYFITICTKNREPYFGTIKNGKMQVSTVGAIAYVLWFEITNHAKNIELGEFVVMPNHVHGILILDGNQCGVGDRDFMNVVVQGGDVVVQGRDVVVQGGDVVVQGGDVVVQGGDVVVRGRDVACNVPTITTIQTTNVKNEKMAMISPKSNTVSSIIRSYKSAVTKYCNRLELPFAWQSRFHDHIIRNDESFQRISEYIRNNPANWADDEWVE
jgi:putative transposase